jgi:lipopolysaccharide assembly protein A
VRAALPLIPAALAIAFAVVNLNQVKVDWIAGSGHAPLIVVIVISLLVGVVFTHLAERVGRKRR